MKRLNLIDQILYKAENVIFYSSFSSYFSVKKHPLNYFETV